jgi:hypothetical protein
VTSSTQKENTSESCGISVSEGEMINNETNPELSYSCCIIMRSNIGFSGNRLLSFRINYPLSLEEPCVIETPVTVPTLSTEETFYYERSYLFSIYYLS